MFERDQAKTLWARSDRFVLTDAGQEAEAAYRRDVLASQVEAGRSSYDAARTAWAQTFSLEPDDGVYLGELRGGPLKMSAIVRALEDCGKDQRDAVEAFRRLIEAGLVRVAD